VAVVLLNMRYYHAWLMLRRVFRRTRRHKLCFCRRRAVLAIFKGVRYSHHLLLSLVSRQWSDPERSATCVVGAKPGSYSTRRWNTSVLYCVPAFTQRGFDIPNERHQDPRSPDCLVSINRDVFSRTPTGRSNRSLRAQP
jgi:hypothetical protein